MKNFVLTLVVNAVTLWLMDILMAGISFPSTNVLLAVALLLGILNATVKPLLKILSFPVTFLTLGLFALVINGIILNLAMSWGGAGNLTLGNAVIASIVFAVINGIVGKVILD